METRRSPRRWHEIMERLKAKQVPAGKGEESWQNHGKQCGIYSKYHRNQTSIEINRNQYKSWKWRGEVL